MGLNFTALTSVLLGIGLGVLAVSCLTVTIVFGRYANSFTKYEKYESKLSFDSKSSMIDSSIAIAVLGCISAVSALAAIVLSILMEEQTLILIIAGGVSSIFAFGCIVAEGVFTKKSVDNILGVDGYSHKGAQKYIKKALKSLYEQAVKNFKYNPNNYAILESYIFPSWSEIENKLGSKIEEEYYTKILTYADLWTEEYSEKPDYLPVNFYLKGSYIYARLNESVGDIRVATLNYKYQENIQDYKKVCWPNSDATNLNCKQIKSEKSERQEDTFDINDINDNYYGNNYFLNEMIVVGDYYSRKQQDTDNIEANYLVSDFPVAFSTTPYGQYLNYPFTSEDSTNHYKISAKKWVKANIDQYKENSKKIDPTDFTLVPYKIKNLHDYKYQELNYKDDYFDGRYSEKYFSESNSFSTIMIILRQNYKNSNKGKVSPADKKFGKLILNYRNSPTDALKESNQDMYQIALINMIIQIFAILSWACGKFIPNGESNESRSQSNENVEKPQNYETSQNDEKEQSEEKSQSNESNQKVQEA